MSYPELIDDGFKAISRLIERVVHVIFSPLALIGWLFPPPKE